MADRYDLLRRMFNSAVDGPNINAFLQSMAVGDNLNETSAEDLFKSMFAATAQGQYLNIHGSNAGISRPNGVGISDEAFRRLITESTSNEISTNAIQNILDIFYDNSFTRAFSETELYEPYSLSNNDDLIVLVDEKNSFELTFTNADFTAIGTITAIELAAIISQKLKDAGSTAFALAAFDSVLQTEKVRIFSGTLGARGVVRITGGKANNTLKFDTFVATTQDTTTEFTVQNYTNAISGLSGITTRFTWTGGTSPGLSAVSESDWVNIGNSFNTLNRGSYPITKVVNGAEDYAYFEVTNATSYTQSVTLSTAIDLAFFRPTKRTIFSEPTHAAVIVGSPGLTQVFIPATTSVVARTPVLGGSYLADMYYTVNHSATTFSVGETLIGNTSKASGMVLSTTSTVQLVLGDVQGTFSAGETILGEESRATATLSSITGSLNSSLSNNYLANFDDYVLTGTSSDTNMAVAAGHQYSILSINDTTNFSSTGGYIYIDYGYIAEEFVPYTAILNSTDLLLDGSYKFRFNHTITSDVTFVKSKSKFRIAGDGSDRGAFLTDIALARNSCVSAIQRISAAGLGLEVTVLYPSDVGLGNEGLTTSDRGWVYGS